MPLSPNHEADSQRRAGAVSAWLGAVTYWYLTGLIAALGFSFGLHLARPAVGSLAPDPDWLNAFNWMDGGLYKQIAAEGYEYDPKKGTNVAFFPIYPLLGRALLKVTGLRVEIALLVASNVSFLAALAMLALYVRDRYPDAPAELAEYTLMIAALFPTGCFFRLTYSESTFLLLVVLAMLAMLRRWPLWSIALVIGLATAARPVGVALLAPFAIHIWRMSAASGSARQQVSTETSISSKAESGQSTGALPSVRSLAATGHMSVATKPTRSLRRRFPYLLRDAAIYLPVACWGFATFTVYQYCAFGEPFATIKVQKYWGTPAASRSEKLMQLITLEPVRSVYDNRSPSFWATGDVHGIPWFSLQFANPLYFVAAIVLVVLGALCYSRKTSSEAADSSLPQASCRDDQRGRWLSLEEVSLSAMLLVIPYVTRAYEMHMSSMARFVTVVFPIYLVFGQILVRLRSPLRAAILALSGCFLAIFSALYAARYAIF